MAAGLPMLRHPQRVKIAVRQIRLKVAPDVVFNRSPYGPWRAAMPQTDGLLTPLNVPELWIAAVRFHEAVREAKAAGYDPATRRMAIKRAEYNYLRVFGEMARKANGS
jgi:hypothetical protein